jgi:aspartyl-tRNA synthetase
MDTMGKRKRTHYCGTLRLAEAGETVTVAGWVQRRRDLGALLFIDLRDRTGLVQLAFDETASVSLREKAASVRGEFVVMATGVVRERSAKNTGLPTGDIEIATEELLILAKSETPPFEIVENSATSELTRLKYRYLDLRRPDLQRNLLARYHITRIARDYFDAQEFIEIETPMLIKSTPEGARDYLVPSRVHPGNFYALPQSPQMYKQLSMVAGFDRYVQFARCFRDEDLRADRQPEFTQIDLEMSFIDIEDLLGSVEGLIRRLSDELSLDIPFPLPRVSYADAMSRYGSDKPDTRYGMELFDISNLVQNSDFAVFSSAVQGGGECPGNYSQKCFFHPYP